MMSFLFSIRSLPHFLPFILFSNENLGVAIDRPFYFTFLQFRVPNRRMRVHGSQGQGVDLCEAGGWHYVCVS
jgi:hypothetical protein